MKWVGGTVGRTNVGLSRKLVRAGLGCTAAAAGMVTVPARADDRLTVDVSAGVSAATNPFLVAGPDTGAASAFLSIQPQFTRTTPVSTLAIRAYGRIEQYTHRYGTDDAGEVSLQYTRRLSERVTVRGGGAFRTNRSNSLDLLSARAPGVGVAPIIVVPVNDVTYIGRQLRTYSGSANLGATFALDPRSSLDIDGAVGFYTFKDPTLSDYRYAQQQIGYGRALSERTRLTANVSVSETDYRRTRVGDSIVVSPLVGVETTLSERLKATVQVGASISSVRQTSGARDHRTTVAFRASLCNEKDGNSACLRVDRSAQPTATGGIATFTSVGASFSRRISRQDTLSLDGSFSRTSDSTLINGHPTYVAAGAELNHNLKGRLYLFGGTQFSQVFDNGAGRKANFQGRIGVRYQFGGLK